MKYKCIIVHFIEIIYYVNLQWSDQGTKSQGHDINPQDQRQGI